MAGRLWANLQAQVGCTLFFFAIVCVWSRGSVLLDQGSHVSLQPAGDDARDFFDFAARSNGSHLETTDVGTQVLLITFL